MYYHLVIWDFLYSIVSYSGKLGNFFDMEDTILSIAGVVISFSLIPQVVAGFKTKTGPVRLATSIPYGLSLSAMSFAYISLELWVTTAITGIGALLWFTLAYQRLIYVSQSR
jgi:uncharacterized protein with PQ loop repeat